MNIKRYIDALHDLHAAIRLADRTSDLQLYAAASTICGELRANLRALPTEERSSMDAHQLENLGRFIEYLGCAVMPVQNATQTQAQYLQRAKQDLTAVSLT